MVPIAREEKPSTSHAYVYGRFAIHAAEVPFDMAFAEADMTFAFVIGCNDGSEYRIPFSNNQPVIFKIAPATCTFRSVVYVMDGEDKNHHYVGGFMANAVFAPGMAYYLGDYVMGVSATTRRWAMEFAYDAYEETTDAMKRTYPSFANMTTVKQLLDAKLKPPPPPDPTQLHVQEQQDLCRKDSMVCRSACDQTEDRTTCQMQCSKKAAACRKGS